MLKKFKIILHKEPEGGYSVYVPCLPGCHSCGDTMKEAKANIKEAISCYIESLQKDGLPCPESTEEIIAEVEVNI